jgi:O-antigen/teichoic acid export membrane protein
VNLREVRQSLLGSTLLRGGVANIILKITSLGLGFVLSVALARLLGPSGFGTYSLVFSVLSLLALPAQFGLPTLIIKETASGKATGEWAQVKGLWSFADVAVLALAGIMIGIATCVFLLLRSQLPEDYLGPLWAGLGLIPLIALVSLKGAALTGLGHVVLGRLPDAVLRPGLFLLLVLFFARARLPETLTPRDAMLLHSAAAVAVLLAAGFLLSRRRPPDLARIVKPRYLKRQWISAAVPLGLFGGMHSLMSYTDTIILGALKPPEDVGVYRVALSVSALTSFGLAAVSMVVAPRFAHLHALGETAKLQRVATACTRLVLAVSAPVVILIVAFGERLLSVVYGEDYKAAFVPLAILSMGHLVNAGVGAVGYLLNMTGHQKDALVGMTGATLTNVALNVVLIPPYGITGAAVATGISMVVWNVASYCFVRRRLGIDTLAWRPLG